MLDNDVRCIETCIAFNSCFSVEMSQQTFACSSMSFLFLQMVLGDNLLKIF